MRGPSVFAMPISTGGILKEILTITLLLMTKYFGYSPMNRTGWHSAVPVNPQECQLSLMRQDSSKSALSYRGRVYRVQKSLCRRLHCYSAAMHSLNLLAELSEFQIIQMYLRILTEAFFFSLVECFNRNYFQTIRVLVCIQISRQRTQLFAELELLFKFFKLLEKCS